MMLGYTEVRQSDQSPFPHNTTNILLSECSNGQFTYTEVLIRYNHRDRRKSEWLRWSDMVASFASYHISNYLGSVCSGRRKSVVKRNL